MEIIPAIDIMGGRVVRLSKGKPQTAKMYDNFVDPIKTAQIWEEEGATRLHIVDLDAAFGQSNNRKIILALTHTVKIPIQIGGGIRSYRVAEEMLKNRVGRVILATLAFKHETIVKNLIDEFGFEKVMIALDYVGDVIMTKGWQNSTGLTLTKALCKYQDLGIQLFLFTSISRDGLLQGPDLPTLTTLVQYVQKGLYVAGGVTSLQDIKHLKAIGVEGVIIGKALYEGNFTLKEALEASGE